ncbi:9297_t:CDS:1 [Ambispora gerdemannii]|uniref:9297_t:CDS:1 n=1 Tax=Ambispora gerdemannii TaxID=144530 RepID=A0A9N9C559_9GLOM|nr:9297_t:CDS:1 [Ambispora gerdemannii]
MYTTIEKIGDYPSPYRRVILLALDGLGLYAKKLTDDGELPTFKRFWERSRSVFNARAQLPSNSAENWGSILHGVVPKKHGLTNVIVNSGRPYDETNGFESVFKILEKRFKQVKLASFAAWASINTGIIEQSIPMERYAPTTHESKPIQWWLWFKHRCLNNSAYDEYVVKKACDYITKKENSDVKLLSIHLVDVDEYGHGHGWGGKYYNKQLRKMDTRINQILKAIDDAGWTDDSLVVMTTDHGGINKGHGGESIEEVSVFFSLLGPGLQKNGNIEEGVSNMDLAAIILKALGVEAPEWFDAKLPNNIFDNSSLLLGEQVN